MLVQALTFACERVFEQTPDSITQLDKQLRIQPWKLFKRLRQHLAALHPNEQMKPLIRDFILEQESYDQWPHHYEFQQMVRSGCERFGTELLDKEDLRRIFEAFLSGPRRDHPPEGLTDEQLDLFRRNFHRMQFKPFESVLFDEFLDYYQQLEAESDMQITEEAYFQVRAGRGGVVRRRSPRSIEDLAGLSDEELLKFLNEWDLEHRYESGEADESWLTEINVEALADAVSISLQGPYCL